MIWCLNKRAELLPPKMGDLQFGSYIKSGEDLSLSYYVLLKPEMKECVWHSSSNDFLFVEEVGKREDNN